MPAAPPVIFEGPALASAVVSATVPQLIRTRARQQPDSVAMIDGISGHSVTYGALDHNIGRVAAGLAAAGLQPGDVLLMFAPNSTEWPIVALGAMAAGGVVSGANPMYNAADLAHQMRDANARFVFTIAACLEVVREAIALTGGKQTIVLGDSNGEAQEVLSLESLLACTDSEPAHTHDPDVLAALPYSSGTTGLAKGVMLTHRNLVSNISQFAQAYAALPTAVSLGFLPMFHIYGFTLITLGGLAVGLKLVILPRFAPESFLQAIASYRVTRVAVVPPVLQFLARHPLVDAYDLSSLERVSCGAAPLGAALENMAMQRLKCPVVQGFGMTESSGCLALTDPRHIRSGSSGQLLPGTKARVVDPETGLDAAGPGELWFRGPQAFKGYLNNPQATAETITQEGWVRTGDMGYIDPDGYLFITDRLKELIKVKGFQVAPAELEALLITHPSVADAAVISRPDERSGEVPVAYVVPRAVHGVAFNPEALKAWVGERVVAYKQLADIVICEAIPKNPSGKILRRVLRAQDGKNNTQLAA